MCGETSVISVRMIDAVMTMEKMGYARSRNHRACT